MAHFYLILANVLAFTVIVQAFHIKTLRRCDDCCSPVKELPHPIRMGDVEYEAFSVCSNGYMHLLPDDTSPIQRLNNQDYVPKRVNETFGSAFIAPFWHDVNLNCPGFGEVGYAVFDADEYSDNVLISAGVDPEVVMFVNYDSVKRFNCPADNNKNTFFMALLTGSVGGVSHTSLFFIYQDMTWDQSSLSSNSPTVGWGDGQGNGITRTLGGPTPAEYLEGIRILIDEIDGPTFTHPQPPLSEAQENGFYNGVLNQAFLQQIKASEAQLGENEDKDKLAQLERISKLFQAIQQQQKDEGPDAAVINWDK